MFSSILVFLIVLSLLVLVHELGHFVVAKRNGIWVEEFGWGIPPRVWGKKIGETIYSINLFPFGGFVRLHGEQTEEGITKPKRAFIHKSKKIKVKVVTAGVVMNFLLGIILFSILYSLTGVPRETDRVKVSYVSENSPAMEAGLKADDVIVAADGQQIRDTQQFVDLVGARKGTEIELTVEHSLGETVQVDLTPREEYGENEGPIGVAISNYEIYFPPVWQRPFLGIYYGFQEAMYWGVTVISSVVFLVISLFRGSVPGGIAGPVGIYAITTEAYRSGFATLINFVGMLSVNLAILNIIPFPALDGGRLLFIVLEKLIGKKVLPKIEATIHAVGMVILLLFIAALTFSDIKNLIAAGSISAFLDRIAP